MRKIFFICLLFALFAVPAAAQNPCATPATTTVYSPSNIHVQITNFNEVLPGTTTPAWTELIIGIFNSGVDPDTGAPLSSTSFSKAQLTLVAGTTDCYLVSTNVLIAQPVGRLQFAAARIRRSAPDTAESPWSANSNPFAKPAALSAPAAVRVTK